MLKALSDQNEARATLKSTLQLLSVQSCGEYPPLTLGLIMLCSILVGFRYGVENSRWTATCYKCTHNSNTSNIDMPRATRQPDMSQAHCTQWWEAHMLSSVSSRAELGKKYFLSLRFGMKCRREEMQNSYMGGTLAVPLLQTVLVSHHSTHLPSNTHIVLVAKIWNSVRTSHSCALVENDCHLLYFVQDM